MHLKHLEIYGFKSFAERVKIDLRPGITAVVGPNGSGKSNITDAIRWVLGEQSIRELRGAKTEDIIFAGTDKRKSINFAEVSIIIDNNDKQLPVDYSEVAITRRVYRSGEGEYLLNGQTCRLKDIQELFLDTGIGRGAYSIIGQGKVEEIIMNKPEERRIYFEEAAGILKHKNRKKEAMRKLESTQQNLLRITDLVSELEKQVRHLETQAQHTQKYNLLKEQLFNKETDLFAVELKSLNYKEENIAVELGNLNAEHESLKKSAAEGEIAIQHAEHSLRASQSYIDELQEEVFAAANNAEKVKGEINVAEERVKGLTEQAEQLCQQDDVQPRLEKIIGDEAAKKLIFEELLAEVRQEEELNEKEGAILFELQEQNHQKEEKLESLKGELFELASNRARLNNEAKGIKDEINTMMGRLDKVSSSIAELQRKVEIQESAINEKRSALQEISEQQHRVSDAIEKHKQKLEDQSQKIEKMRKESQTLAFQSAEAQSRLSVLEDMEREYDGYSGGVKALMSLPLEGFRKKIYGSVADLIKVEPRYELAIEVALGQAIQNVIIESEDAACEAIDYLKKNHAGRVTFLPLNTVGLIKRERNKAIKAFSGFLGFADQLVNFEGKFERIFYHLLANVCVVEKMSDAIKLARHLNFRQKIVTLAGEIINPGGAMTGGSFGRKRSTILGRKNEIKQYREKVSILTQKVKEYEARIQEENSSRVVLENELLEMLKKAEHNREHLEELEKQLWKLDNEISDMKEQILYKEAEAEEIKKELSIKNEQLNAKEAALLLLNTKDTDFQHKIHNLREEIQQGKDLQKSIASNLTAKRIALAANQQALKDLEEQIKNIQMEKQYWEEESERRGKLLKKVRTELEKVNEELECKRKELNDFLRQKDELEKKLSDAKKNHLTIQGMLEKYKKEKEQKLQQLQSIQERLNAIQVKEARLEAERNNLYAQFSEKYGEAELPQVDSRKVEEDRNSLQQSIRRLKEEIAAIGPVNPQAIEEYQEHFQKLQFLLEQQEDLREAKETLHQVIGEIDRSMEKRFRETFSNINNYFQEIFRSLFGGGKAELCLVEGENLLNCGVEIVAQPPGKKLQNLSLLSGGEKTLTATALLFAFLKQKPSPFVVLDEIEASLDESNVDRFASFLKNFSREIQFIIVTHQKKTMGIADILYGVTMQESGISSLVSVRFNPNRQKVS